MSQSSCIVSRFLFPDLWNQNHTAAATAVPYLRESAWEKITNYPRQIYRSGACEIYSHSRIRELSIVVLIYILEQIPAYLRTCYVATNVYIIVRCICALTHIFDMCMRLDISWSIFNSVDGQLARSCIAFSTCIGDPLWLPIWIKRVIGAGADLEKKKSKMKIRA